MDPILYKFCHLPSENMWFLWAPHCKLVICLNATDGIDEYTKDDGIFYTSFIMMRAFSRNKQYYVYDIELL